MSHNNTSGEVILYLFTISTKKKYSNNPISTINFIDFIKYFINFDFCV